MNLRKVRNNRFPLRLVLGDSGSNSDQRDKQGTSSLYHATRLRHRQAEGLVRGLLIVHNPEGLDPTPSLVVHKRPPPGGGRADKVDEEDEAPGLSVGYGLT